MSSEDKTLVTDDLHSEGCNVVLTPPNMGGASGRFDIRRPMDLETIG